MKETFTVTVRPRTRLRRIASVGRIRTTKVRPPFSVTVRVPTVAAPRLTRTRTRQLAAPFAQLTVMPNRPFASTRTDRFASRIVGAFPGVAGFAGVAGVAGVAGAAGASGVPGAPGVAGDAGVAGSAGAVGAASSGANANCRFRSPGLHFSFVLNTLPVTHRNMLGFVTLGAWRTFVACSNA
ncbi:unannotated protein [freshwater metagenome]|uniref:Unannotated protein n=1 Tax=freshwater metagenome TaxID=449393 RepID=A0A6J7L8N6_9ZZZZ